MFQQQILRDNEDGFYHSKPLLHYLKMDLSIFQSWQEQISK
jgi:hypothetical protein